MGLSGIKVSCACFKYVFKQLPIDFDSVKKLSYLDMFIKEVLRFYPIANVIVARRCTNATNVNGIDIPVDLEVVVDVLSIHFDQEIWGPTDPNIFYPLRYAIFLMLSFLEL